MSESQENSSQNELMLSKAQKMAVDFLMACMREDSELIKKMIFEDNIEYTKAIQTAFKHTPKPGYKIAQEMFEKRELNKSLNQDLKINDLPEKKPKV